MAEILLRLFRDDVSGDVLYLIGPPTDNVLIIGQNDVTINGPSWPEVEVREFVRRYMEKMAT